MESLLILLAIVVVVGVPGGIIVALFWLGSLSGRVARIEASIVDLRAELRARKSPSPDPAPKSAEAPAPWSKTTPDVEPAPVAPTPPEEMDKAAARVGPKITVPDLGPGARPSRPRREGPSLVDQAFKWISTNWFYAVAAVSLALAGIFLVQYGVEQGLLPPPIRVLAAVAFGALLIAGGEYIRRRWGDGAEVATAYLPSILSGGGVVTLFGAILGARHLYDLIGQGQALAGMVVVALGAIVLGWFHGPFLIAIGMLGGAVAPFVVGGGRGSDLRPLHGLFALLAFSGLAVDMVRRWWPRWVSWLALAVGFGASALLVVGAPETTAAHIIAVTLIALSAMALPIGRIMPDHGAPMVTAALRRRAMPTPGVMLAGAAILVAAMLAVLGQGEAFWFATGALVVLFAALSAWAKSAEGLEDLALLPPVFLLILVLTSWPAEGDAAITLMLIAGGAMSVLAFQRSLLHVTVQRLGWALGTVLIAPAIGIALHLAWGAPVVLGFYPWALHALAVAAGLVGVASIWAARDGEDRLRTSLAALVALTVIAYALGQVAGEAALTAAVAFMAAAAAWFDRRFNLPLLGWFVVLAAPFIGWRLLAVPGVEWHLEGDLLPALLSMLAPVAAFALAWFWLRGRGRPEPEAVAETAAISVAGYAITLLLWRGLDALDVNTAHLAFGLTAILWLVFAWAQAELRLRGGRIPWLRTALAGLFAVLGAGTLLLSVTIMSPLFGFPWGNEIIGYPVLNTLLPAYLLPAVLLVFAGRRLALQTPDKSIPKIVFGTGAILIGHWVFLAIRHFWRGAEDMMIWEGFSQPEITSYTVALLILGTALFYQGVAKASDLWRRAGVIVLGVTVAKVFLIDAASLGGLLRVGAFVGLAFALGGLAWLDRWAGKMAPTAPSDGDGPSDAPPDNVDGQIDPDTDGGADPDGTGPGLDAPDLPETDGSLAEEPRGDGSLSEDSLPEDGLPKDGLSDDGLSDEGLSAAGEEQDPAASEPREVPDPAPRDVAEGEADQDNKPTKPDPK